MAKRSKREIMIERMEDKKREVKTVRRIVLIVFLSALLLLIVGGAVAYTYVSGALKPVDPDSEKIVEVEVPIGSNLDSIAQRLEDKGIIRNAKIFKYYAKFNNESDFQAGNYGLTKSMTPDELIESLKTGKVYRTPVFTFTVPEGLTLDQISKVIEDKTDYTGEQFMELVQDPGFVDKMMELYPGLLTDEVKNEHIKFPLEGYLFPATYPVYEENPTLESLVKMMLEATDQAVTPYRDVLAEQEHSVHWLLTFASLLEKEATAATDRKAIASVFFNRIDEGMPLQTDPTVAYAHGEHLSRTMYSDLEIDDAYNTYKNQGLPPGPIANAGKSSIEAVLDPVQSDYLYFLADKEGNNHFAVTYEEHLKNRDKYITNGE
ncbi:endolytic transglycosylase MltG [Bhargavaea cecembensis]|uniref:endolytic transglycosylase MltG n=1 Tax=Bhargavaea cecembensis TaxID=394098 RepID=UPI000A5C1AF0|nr:endolytic transglycosylase MltG [Bhargavaea cecembensis]